MANNKNKERNKSKIENFPAFLLKTDEFLNGNNNIVTTKKRTGQWNSVAVLFKTNGLKTNQHASESFSKMNKKSLPSLMLRQQGDM